MVTHAETSPSPSSNDGLIHVNRDSLGGHLMWLVRTPSSGSHHLPGHDLGRVGEQ